MLMLAMSSVLQTDSIHPLGLDTMDTTNDDTTTNDKKGQIISGSGAGAAHASVCYVEGTRRQGQRGCRRFTGGSYCNLRLILFRARHHYVTKHICMLITLGYIWDTLFSFSYQM